MTSWINIHGEEGGTGTNIYFDNLEELKSKGFWKKYLINKIVESANETINQVQNLNKNMNILTFKSEAGSTSSYSNLLSSYLSGFGNEVFIPEFLEEDLSQYDTLNKIKAFVSQKLNVYNSEFDFRNKQGHDLYSIFRTNKNIVEGKNLKEIIDGNSTKIKNITKEHLNILKDYKNEKNYMFNPKELNITNNENIDALNSKLKNLKTDESLKYITKNHKDQVKITAKKCFFGRPINYVKQHGYLVEFQNEDFIYYESGFSGYDFIMLNLKGVTYTYVMYNWGSFINLIDNLRGLYSKIDKFPKYERMDDNYKELLLKHLEIKKVKNHP